MGVFFFKRFFLDRLPGDKPVRPVNEITDEFLVPESFGEQQVGNGYGQRPIVTGLYGQPFISLGRCGRESGFNNSDFGLVERIPPHAGVIGHLTIGGHRIRAPYQNVPCVFDVILTVIPIPLRVVRAKLFGLGTNGTVGDIVRRSYDLGHAIIKNIPHVTVTSPHEHVFVGLVVIPEFHDLVGDGIQGLVPGNGDKPWIFVPALLRVGSLHGGFDAVRIVDLLQAKVGAHTAVRDVYLGIWVSPDFDCPAVDHIYLFRAP